jgi:hypothetical protein
MDVPLGVVNTGQLTTTPANKTGTSAAVERGSRNIPKL